METSISFKNIYILISELINILFDFILPIFLKFFLKHKYKLHNLLNDNSWSNNKCKYHHYNLSTYIFENYNFSLNIAIENIDDISIWSDCLLCICDDFWIFFFKYFIQYKVCCLEFIKIYLIICRRKLPMYLDFGSTGRSNFSIANEMKWNKNENVQRNGILWIE